MKEKQLYQIGDKVWFMKDNRPVQEEISGVQSKSEQGEPIIEKVTDYSLSAIKNVTNTTYKMIKTFEYCTNSIWFHHKEYDIAKTKGELIEKIFFSNES